MKTALFCYDGFPNLCSQQEADASAEKWFKNIRKVKRIRLSERSGSTIIQWLLL